MKNKNKEKLQEAKTTNLNAKGEGFWLKDFLKRNIDIIWGIFIMLIVFWLFATLVIGIKVEAIWVSNQLQLLFFN